MVSALFFSSLVGAVVGGVVSYVKFRSAVWGALLGATAGMLLGFALFRSPARVIAVEEPSDFNENVLKADVPVVVDFYADWCPPCRRLAPVIEDLCGEYGGRVRFVKINVSKSPRLAQAYGIRGIPTVMLFIDGELRHTWRGCQPAENYRSVIDSFLRAEPQR